VLERWRDGAAGALSIGFGAWLAALALGWR
jgi:hypothetical protein